VETTLAFPVLLFHPVRMVFDWFYWLSASLSEHVTLGIAQQPHRFAVEVLLHDVESKLNP
jgi:hypothetical protein